MSSKKIRAILLAFFLGISSLYSAVNHWDNLCLVNAKDPDHRFVLLFVPKNASTFLRNYLDTIALSGFEKEKYENSTKIFVARNPLYRPISIYNEVLKLYYGQRTKHENFYLNRANTIDSFVEFLDIIEDDFYEPHVSHQYWYLKNKDLTLEDMDFIFLFEELDKDLKVFCKTYQLPYQPSKMNMSLDSRKQNLVKFINSNKEIQEKIRKIWWKDFLLYEEAKIQRKKIFANLNQ